MPSEEEDIVAAAAYAATTTDDVGVDDEPQPPRGWPSSESEGGGGSTRVEPIRCLPAWTYKAPHPSDKPLFDPLAPPVIDSIDLGDYVRNNVTNLQPGSSKDYFDMGLRLMLSYQVSCRCVVCARCRLRTIEQ